MKSISIMARLSAGIVALLMQTAALAQPAPVEAEQDGIWVRASAVPDAVLVEWRLVGIPSAPPSVITADIAGRPLAAPLLRAYPGDDAVTAVLFLIDISDPRRQPVLDWQAAAITAIMAAARPHHHFGLATFDAELAVVRALGSPPDAIVAGAASLRAVGQATELYRAVRSAAAMLKSYPANRKALFVLSDGQAEDKAYSHADAAAAAREAGVEIYGLGYAASAGRTAALQTLRRLAEETGGLFVPAALPDHELPAPFLLNPFALVDSGGRVVFPIGDAYRLPFAPAPSVTIALRYGESAFGVTLPVDLPFPRPAQWRQVWKHPDQRIYAVAFAMVLAVLVGVAVLAAALLARRRRRQRAAAAPAGYLEILDSAERRHPIAGNALGIGRDPDNDLVLANTSVSAHHAALHRRRDGEYMLTDLDSTNGVRVNDQTVREALLNDGDIVELGEVRLRFVRA